MNFKNEIESQFGLSRKSNNNVYYSGPKVQTHIKNKYNLLHLTYLEKIIT